MPHWTQTPEGRERMRQINLKRHRKPKAPPLPGLLDPHHLCIAIRRWRDNEALVTIAEVVTFIEGYAARS